MSTAVDRSRAVCFHLLESLFASKAATLLALSRSVFTTYGVGAKYKAHVLGISVVLCWAVRGTLTADFPLFFSPTVRLFCSLV